jgi:hypothetical protein
MTPSVLSESFEYSDLKAHFIDYGAAKHIPLDKLLDFLAKRVRILAETASTPGLDSVKTELVRGQRREALAILTALQDEVPGLTNPNGQIPSGAEHV